MPTKIFKIIGYVLCLFGILILGKTIFPITKSEISYQVSKKNQNQEIIPVNTEFSLVIPKIKVNTPVIKNIDPRDPKQYQQALTQGVAHAKDSAFPGFPGNVFIFAHSATDWYQANRYNAVFYLTNKLEKDDQIILYYQGSKYIYKVVDKKIVEASDIKYLTDSTDKYSLTLMTCWPPGTSVKRLVIRALLF